MTTVINKGQIGEQDLYRFDGSGTNTFTRDTSTGATLTLTKIGYEVNALSAYGGGVLFTDATVTAALTAIGTTNKATMYLAPGTWVFNENIDYSAYTNITFKLPPGAIISHGAYTLNIPNIEAGLYQIFTGAGAVTLSGSTKTSYPEWFATNTTPGTTDMTSALQGAITALSSGGTVKLSTTTYAFTNIAVTTADTTVEGDGWGCILKTTASIAVATDPIIWAKNHNITLRGFKLEWATSPDKLITGTVVTSNNAISFGYFYAEGGALPTAGNLVIQNGLVENVYIYEGKCHGIMIGRSNNVTVKNCRVEKVWGTGITSVCAKNFQILDNYITMGHDAAIDPNSDAYRVITFNTGTHEPLNTEIIYAETTGVALWVDTATLTSGAWDGTGVGTILYGGGIYGKEGLEVGEHLHASAGGAGNLIAIVASVEQPAFGPDFLGENTTIRGNIIYKGQSGIGMHAVNGAIIDSNIIDGVWGDSITIQPSTYYGCPYSYNITITNNIIRHPMRWYTGDTIFGSDSYWADDHSTYVTGSTYAINATIYGNLIISNNVIDDDSGLQGTQGAMFLSADNIVISGNSIKQDWPSVFSITGTNPSPAVDATQIRMLSITGNDVYVTPTYGYYGIILVSVAQGVISGNNFNLGQDTEVAKSLLYSYYAENILVEGNTFKNYVTQITDSGYCSNIVFRNNIGAYDRPSSSPTAKTDTTTVTVANVLTGIIVGTPTAAATYTLDTGTLFDANGYFATYQWFDWTIINLASAAADRIITVAGDTGHTIIGLATVAANHSTTGALHGSSARFRTQKTAANTFITYRIG